jgi:hypothetical protein
MDTVNHEANKHRGALHGMSRQSSETEEGYRQRIIAEHASHGKANLPALADDSKGSKGVHHAKK